MPAHANLWLQAVEACPSPTAFLDARTRFRQANGAYLRWLGLGWGEIAGRTLEQVLGAGLAADGAPYVDIALAGGSVTFETSVALRRRGVRRMQAQYTAALDAAGETVGFFAYLADVTARQDAEDAVALALDGLGDGYLAVNPELRFSYVNSAAARFCGLAREEILGRPVDSVFPGALAAPAGDLLRQVIRTRTPVRAVLPCERPATPVMLEIVPLAGGGAGVVLQSLDARAWPAAARVLEPG